MFTQSNVRALGYEAKVHCESGSCWPASHRPPVIISKCGRMLESSPGRSKTCLSCSQSGKRWRRSRPQMVALLCLYIAKQHEGGGGQAPLANSKVPIKRSNHQSCGRQTDQLSHIGASSIPVFISTSAASRLTRRC